MIQKKSAGWLAAAVLGAAVLGAATPEPAPALFCDEALRTLFTPAHPIVGRYDVCTTKASIDEVLEQSRSEGARYGAIEPIDPADAFGSAGSYDRFAVARLYGGHRPRVARGWSSNGERFQSLTLISPFPDRTLRRLLPGTLVVRYLVTVRGL